MSSIAQFSLAAGSAGGAGGSCVAREAIAVGVGRAAPVHHIDYYRHDQPKPVIGGQANSRAPQNHIHQRGERQKDDPQDRPQPAPAERSAKGLDEPAR